MPYTPVFLTITLVAVTALSACSSAPGATTLLNNNLVSLPEAEPFVSRTDLPENGAVALLGQAHTAKVTRKPTAGGFNGSISDHDEFMGPASTVTDSTLVMTFENGKQVATHLLAGTSGLAIDTREDGEFTEEDPTYGMGMWSKSNRARAQFVRPSAQGFDHMSYGTWSVETSDTTETVGAGVFGAATPQADMPTSGAATYRGRGAGFLDTGNGSIASTEFEVNVATSDFNSVTINSSNTLITDLTHNSGVAYNSDYDFSGSGSISGSRVQANLSSTNMSGTAEGQFFGSTGQELGATFALDGSGGTHIGAFGASR